MSDSGFLTESLQHPRRNLGNRYRSQAEKFLALSNGSDEYLSWAEQNARQSVLYDFTNSENWKALVQVKTVCGETDGVRAVLEDLFVVLGRDPENMSQLEGVDLLSSAMELLDGALAADPLDPSLWWERVGRDKEKLAEFSMRIRGLDISDSRANILFSRRLERIGREGDEELFLELTRILLAQRPDNHELWEEIGRLYERRGEYDQAWLCYDQAQLHFPSSSARVRFKERMEGLVEGKNTRPWRTPEISDRVQFLDRMQKLSARGRMEISEIEEEDSDEFPFSEVDMLIQDGRTSEAFFLARRMAAEGIDGAESKVNELLEIMRDGK
tara:strand:+ start:751 stop:1734 length:984 start_codon:yes stop_codon:yes gene_type:complete